MAANLKPLRGGAAAGGAGGTGAAAGAGAAAGGTGANNKSKNNKGAQIRTSAYNFIPVLVATFLKILPFALYVSTLMESLLFNDVRGFFIFIGLLLNDCLNTAYNYMVGKKDNEACAIVRNMYSTEEFLVLPTTHTEYITFVTAFLMSSMFFKQVFNYAVFVIFSVLVGMTAYSRVSSGCKDFIDAGYSILLGAFKGIIYYVVVKDFYEPKDVTPEEHWLEKALKKILPKSDADDFV